MLHQRASAHTQEVLLLQATCAIDREFDASVSALTALQPLLGEHRAVDE